MSLSTGTDVADDLDEMIIEAKEAMRSTLDLVQLPILITSDEALSLGLMTVREQVFKALESVRAAHKTMCELRETCIQREVRMALVLLCDWLSLWMAVTLLDEGGMPLFYWLRVECSYGIG